MGFHFPSPTSLPSSLSPGSLPFPFFSLFLSSSFAPSLLHFLYPYPSFPAFPPLLSYLLPSSLLPSLPFSFSPSIFLPFYSLPPFLPTYFLPSLFFFLSSLSLLPPSFPPCLPAYLPTQLERQDSHTLPPKSPVAVHQQS